MALLDFLFKARPQRSASEEPARPGYAFGSTSRRIATYDQIYSAEKAICHPATYRCLKKIGDSVASVNWYVEKDPTADRAAQEDKERQIKALNDLLKSPNDSLAPDQLRFWMALVLAAYGRVPFKIGVGMSNNPNGIYPLDAQYVTEELNSRGIVESYKYGMAEKFERLPTRRKVERDNGGVTAKSYAYQIFIPGLSGAQEVGKSLSPLNALGLPARVIEALLQRAVDTAEGHPNSKYVVATEKTLTEKQFKALNQHLGQMEPGEEDSGNVLLLRNTSVQVHKLDNDLNNIHSKMPMDDMTRMIAGAFGIPISLLGLGAADGAKFAGNFEESRLAFWEDTIIPSYLGPIATGMTQAICPTGLRVSFDYDTIPAIQHKRIAQAKELNGISFLTVNEKREAVDYQRLDGAEYDRLQAAPRTSTQGDMNNQTGEE